MKSRQLVIAIGLVLALAGSALDAKTSGNVSNSNLPPVRACYQWAKASLVRVLRQMAVRSDRSFSAWYGG